MPAQLRKSPLHPEGERLVGRQAVGRCLRTHEGLVHRAERPRGDLRRAPAWMRRARLEWLHIVRRQPHKARRYFVGIPTFLLRCLAADLSAGHGVEPQR